MEKNVRVEKNDKYQWRVIDENGNEIVPFGKYSWIDTFDSGLARVNIDTFKDVGENTGIRILSKTLWGIINTDGEEVLPVEYDSVWKFAGKNRISTNVEKDGKKWLVYFRNLKSADEEDEDDNYDDYGNNYYDNYTIEDSYRDAFDGFPDAYWNID